LSHRLLLVEDEPGIRHGILDFFTHRGYQVDVAETVAGAAEMLAQIRPDAAIVDYRLPDGEGTELLALCARQEPAVPVVLLTGYATVEMAVRAVKEGAEHVLTKPVHLPALEVLLARTIATRQEKDQRQALRSRASRDVLNPFVGRSLAIRQLEEMSHRICASDSPVLIQGETGVGKELMARYLHAQSSRASGELVDLNCAGLSKELLESELFGYEKGAFTGAAAVKLGMFEVADKGTLFLDEIGDVDSAVQPRLLKVLDEQRFRRLGSIRDRKASVRLIAATNVDLGERVRSGQFRNDLYFRISTVPLHIAPLRDRREDIPLLAEQVFARLRGEMRRSEVSISGEAIDALCRYDFPGNTRELHNLLERALLLCDGSRVAAADLRLGSGSGSGSGGGGGGGGAVVRASSPNLAVEPSSSAVTGAFALSTSLEEVERSHVLRVLESVDGRVDVAARMLQVPRSSLYRMLKRYGVSR
jgi:DNA-binding NtrC family response regulator